MKRIFAFLYESKGTHTRKTEGVLESDHEIWMPGAV